MAMPDHYFVNVHNEEFPAGAIRGQLSHVKMEEGMMEGEMEDGMEEGMVEGEMEDGMEEGMVEGEEGAAEQEASEEE